MGSDGFSGGLGLKESILGGYLSHCSQRFLSTKGYYEGSFEGTLKMPLRLL